MDAVEKLLNCTGFDWDQNNIEKIWAKHKVSPFECEQVFFNEPLLAQDDVKHSQKEARYYILGQTDKKRMLFFVFTIRGNLIRVISARDLSKKERQVYRSL
jgi:uncharacterized DUF497 family protein